jgi:hypothetical protein
MEDYLLYGQTEDVYYDSQRPARNSLHDFSEKMRRNLLFAGVLLSGIAAIIARILYAKAEARKLSS